MSRRTLLSVQPRKVLILGSYAPSLLHFRGPLIRDMVARGHSVVAAAPSITGELPALAEVGAVGVELPLVNSSLNPFDLLRSMREVRSLVREHRPQVLVSYTIKPVILGALAGHLERVPTIVSMITGVGYAFTEGRTPKRLISRAAAWPLYRLALARSHRIIFQNRDDQGLFQRLRLVPPGFEPRVVNGSGVDLDHYASAPLPGRAAFLMIARLLKDKGIREFAQAAKRIKAQHPETPITLVGRLDPSPDSLTPEELRQLVLAGIDFQGELRDIRQAMVQCSVYVLPSYREGTPRSVLEAMAMGRPVVTTDTPGCRETVRDGSNGFLVPPRDADALYEAMMRFVRDPALIAPMGAASRTIAEQKYDVRRVNTEVLDYVGL